MRTRGRQQLHDPLGLEKQQLSNLYRGFIKAANGRQELPLQNFAWLLSNYTQLEPSTIRQIFTRMTNSTQISWDRFLELLHRESLLRNTVLNQRIAPQIAIEMEHVQSVAEVNRELKRLNKEARRVEQIDIQNSQFLMVLVDSELILVDQSDWKLALRLVFEARYNQQPSSKKKLGASQNLTNNSMGQLRDNGSRLTQNDFASGILTSNLKKSIKLLNDKPEKSSNSHTRQNSPHDRRTTSQVSSAFFVKRSTLKKKQQFDRLKRSNIDQIFQLFKDLPAEKDVELCRLYSQSDEPELLVDRALTSYLQHRQPLGPPNSNQRTDFRGFISTMRKQGNKLSYNPRRLSVGDEMPNLRGQRFNLLMKDPRPVRDKATALENSTKKRNVHIHSYSIHRQLIAVALATKEVRILKMRKYFFNKVITEELLCRSYHESLVFVHLYECSIRVGKLFLLLASEENQLACIKVRELTDKMELGSVMFSYELPFFPQFDVVKDVGVACHNERGQLALLQISGFRSKELVCCLGPYQLRNQALDKSVPISVVRYHKRSLSLVFGCLDGFVHSYSYSRMELRRIKRLAPKGIVGLEIDEKFNCLLTLAADGKCRLVNIESFEVFNELDLNDRNISATRGLFLKRGGNQEQLLRPNASDVATSNSYFYVFGQNVAKVYLTEDAAKLSKLTQDQTIFNERIKMFRDSRDATETNTSAGFSTIKHWVSNGYILMMSESGEVQMFQLQGSTAAATRFYPRKTRNIVEMGVCPAGILYAQADESFNIEVANILTQQVVLACKIEGVSALQFLPKDMRQLLCVGTNRGDCILLPETASELLTEHKAPKQTLVAAISRVQVTVCRFFDKQLVTGNDRGEVCIFTKNLHSLKHCIKLNLAAKNARMDSIVSMKQLGEGDILVLTSQPAIFEIDALEGTIREHFLLPCQQPELILDFTASAFCQKSATMNSLKVHQRLQNKQWACQTFSELELRLLDIYCCWFTDRNELRVVSTTCSVANLQYKSGKWRAK